MAKDDYFVLAYRLLDYLYTCLKRDKKPNWEYMMYETKQFPISENYNFTGTISLRESLFSHKMGIAALKNLPDFASLPKE